LIFDFRLAEYTQKVSGTVIASAFCEAISSPAWGLLRRQKTPSRNDGRVCSDTLLVYPIGLAGHFSYYGSIAD
jgi:hypothetical protein